MGDARVLSSEGSGRLSRPDWGNIDTFGNTQFVRYFGPVVDRRKPADVAWADERFFCHAKHAMALPDLQASRDIRCAFRRLFVAEGKVVARIEVGFSPTVPVGETPEALVAVPLSIGRLAARVPEEGGPGSTRPLISQGRRLARLYAYSTTKKGAPTESARLVEAGRPMVLVELRRSEAFTPPESTRVIDPERVGGCDLAFLWLATDSGGVPAWIMRPGRDPSRARSLRLSLLRLNAERESLAVVIRLMNREALHFEPETDPGQRLKDYLNTSTRRLKQDTWSGISQSAVVEAIDATQEVTESADREGLQRSLEGVEHQIAAKVESYFKEREATRPGETYNVSEGGIVVNRGINIKDSTITGSNVIAAETMRDALVKFQAAPVSDERKQAVADLVNVATDLVGKLPDEKAKADVTKRVEVITKQAAEDEPLEDVVRAAGETIVKIGQGVADLAEPIAKAVNAVLSVLKFAPLVL
jgi:hypothetical protein